MAERPLKSYLPRFKIKKILDNFKFLGAKSVEITGGGEPMLYRDRETNEDINSIIEYAYKLGYEIGMITNTGKLNKLKKENFSKLKWLRISLNKLDEGFNPEDYDFCDFPEEKMGLSYIIYEENKGTGTRVNKNYIPTNRNTIQKIAKVVELHPKIKFVNCWKLFRKRKQVKVRDNFKEIIDEIDTNKIFIKDIGHDDSAFEDGCYVGL